MQQGGVVGSYEDSVVPSAGAYDDPFGLGSLLTRLSLVEAVLYLSQISGTDRQVCGVERKALTLATFDGFVRQPTARMVEGVGRSLLVFQRVTPDVIFAAGILLPGATGIGRYLTYRSDEHTNDES